MSREEDNRRSMRTLILGLAFGTVLIVMVLRGGMCQRYENEMNTRRAMQEYLNSQRK